MPRLRGLLVRLDGVLFVRGDGAEATVTDHVVVPGAADVLTRCFSRYRLGLVADAGTLDASAVRDVLVEIDWHGYFETVATPADLGVDAASAGMVRSALSSMGVLPSAAAVVVDDPAAAAGAGAAGAHVCVVGDPSVPTLADVPAALRRIEDDA